MRKLLKLADRWRFSLLLLLLLGAVFLEPLLPDATWGGPLMIVLFAVIFILAIHVTRPDATVSGLGIAITGLWMAVSLVATALEAHWLDAVAIGVTILLTAMVVWRTLAALFLEGKADGDALAGAVFGYLLIAVLWGEVFRAIEVWRPGSLSFPGDVHAGSETLYFSLVTITTLGYGDILPVAPFTRILAGIEAALGTLYIAVLIGRIVGALKRPAPPEAGSGGQSPASGD